MAAKHKRGLEDQSRGRIRMASKKEQIYYQGRVYEDLLQDAYKALTSSDKNPRGVWRREEDAEVIELGRALRKSKRKAG